MTAENALPELPADLAPIAAAFANDPAVDVARAFASVCLRADGKIFAMLNAGRLVVKIPRAAVDALVAAGHGERFKSGAGRPMREWVALPPERRRSWLALAREARAFAAE